MTDTFHVLAQGQLPASIGTLYTVPAATTAIVKSMSLVNPTGGAVTASLTVNGTGNANQILPAATILAGGWADFEGTLTLAAGNTISGVGGSAASVTYTIYGDEIT